MGDHVLPTASKDRKDVPLARGVLDYFPAALAEVAKLSRAGNDKHNPGEPMHHARGKSADHADCIVRHLLERGTLDDEDGILHDVKVAWRALALLQEALEEHGAPLARGARLAADESQLCPNYAGDRIAGDDEGTLARTLKNTYYHGEDDPDGEAERARAQAFISAGRDPNEFRERYNIYGYCAWCDMELRQDKAAPYRHESGLIFCNRLHHAALLAWQKGKGFGP